jgi:sulfonate transport system substrate-binding protein
LRFHLGIAALLGLIALGAHPARAEDPPVIRIGFAQIGVGGRPFASHVSLAIAHVRGTIEQELASTGAKVDWQFFQGAGPAVTEALAGGQLDFAFHGDLPAIVARSAGIKTRLLMATSLRSNTYVAVPTASSLVTLADLKGRTVASFRGTAGQLTAARILNTVGLSENDLKIVNLDSGGTSAALAAGQINAAFVTYLTFGLRDQGLIRFIYSTRDQPLALGSVGSIFVTDAFAKKYPTLVNAVVKGAVAAARWGSDPVNRQGVFDIWSKSGVPAQYFAEDYRDEDLRDSLNPLLDDFVVAQYKRAVADAARFGLIRAPVDVDTWLDREPLDAALNTLNLKGYWPELGADGHPKVEP